MVGIINLITFQLSAQSLEIGRASIHPSVATLEVGQQQKFKIIRMATSLKSAKMAEKVEWSVNNVPGGNSEIGTIDKNGVYSAPAVVPSPHEINIIGKIDGVVNNILHATVLMDADKPFYELVYEFADEIGKSEYFTNPHCICLDKDGNLLIADYDGNRCLRFTPDGEYLGDLGKGVGQEDGYVYKPRVVFLDNDDNIFVSDQKDYGNRIQVFSAEGEFLRSFAPKGTGPGEILRAHGIGFDSKNRLYIVDVDNMRVNIYKHDGEFIKSFGKDGPANDEFNAPHGLVVDPNDDVFISSYYGSIKKFDSEGNYLETITETDPPDGSVYIHTITGDKWGNVYAMVRGMKGYGGKVEISKGKVVSMEKFNNNGDKLYGMSLAVKAHSENWVFSDDKGWLYFIYRSKGKLGFEIFKPI